MRHLSCLQLSLAGLLAAALPALAQTAPPVITRAELPTPGDTLRLSQAAPRLPAGAPALSLSGANQTWNFAGLVPATQRVEAYADLSRLPLTQQLTFGPFGGVNRANLVSPQVLPLPAGTALPVAVSDPVALFNFSTTDFRSVGFGLTISGLALPITYRSATEQDVVYRLPLRYGQAPDVSRSYFEVNVPGTAFFAQKRQRDNVVDAWGTLTTPFGTFQTLRVVSKILDRDSLASGGAPGQGLVLPLRREYKWLAREAPVPLLTVITNEVAGQEVVFSIEYRDIYRRLPVRQPTATRDAALNAALAAYPNPLPAGADLYLRGLSGRGPLTISVTDVLGRVLFRLATDGHTEALTVPAAALGTGLRLLLVSGREGIAVRRLVRE